VQVTERLTLSQRWQRHWWRARPSIAMRLLMPLAALYGWLAARAASRAVPQQAPVPVIVVGNLVVGGAGKTPTVIALVQALRDAGRRPGIVSRGYGRRDDAVQAVATASTAEQVGDEPLLMARRTGVPVWVGRDRVAAARALCAAHPEVDVLVSDDGLQHHRLARQLQVLLFDERGAGNRLLLPAGPLRQPLPSALPALPPTWALYNAPAPTTPLPGFVVSRGLAGAITLAEWWRGAAPNPQALRALAGRPVLAAAGMAHPQRFFAMLAQAGLVVRALPLPDHHDWRELPWPADAGDVIVTEKDAVKLDPQRIADGTRVWVATLDFRLPSPFVQALLAHLPPPLPASAAAPAGHTR
jgi:tetraacyldisaccharide 4'-kinase